jgi:hypothetical protein
MSKPFIRTVDLIIGPLTEDQGGGPVKSAYRIISTGDRNSLRVKFNVKKTLLGAPNPSTIEIYNMSRASLERIKKSLSRVRLEVGYENAENTLLTQGAIKSIEVERQGADVITRIVLLDGWGGQIKGITNRTYGAKQSVADIVRDIASNMPGVTIGDIDVDGIIGRGGLTVSDRSADMLDRLAGQYGFSWSIQNGTFQAISDKRTLSRIVEISSKQRNLIKAVPVLNGPEQIQTALEIQAILNPRVTPGHKVKLTSDLNPRLNGFYKVHEVDFDGDTGDQSWNMTIRSITFG